MRQIMTVSKQGKSVLTISLLVLLLGVGLAAATEQQLFRANHEFLVVDPAEPIIETSVQGIFIDRDIVISVSLSSHEGVRQLNGTYTVVVERWNDTTYQYEAFQTLAEGESISLTPEPTVLAFGFSTSERGYYNVAVEFTTTSYEVE